MDDAQPDLPGPGWYPDPQAGPGDGPILRWWDGTRWTPHTRTDPGWGTTPEASASDPQKPTRTASGMRPITGLFSDVVEILRLGWKQLLSIALLAGALAALVVAGAVAIGVDVSGLTELLRKTADAVAELTDPSVDDPDRSALQEAADIAFPLASGQYVVLLAATGILLLLVIATTVAGTVATSSAALRSGAVTFGPVLRTARRRALPTAAMLAVLGVVAVAPWLLSAVLVDSGGADHGQWRGRTAERHVRAAGAGRLLGVDVGPTLPGTSPDGARKQRTGVVLVGHQRPFLGRGGQVVAVGAG